MFHSTTFATARVSHNDSTTTTAPLDITATAPRDITMNGTIQPSPFGHTEVCPSQLLATKEVIDFASTGHGFREPWIPKQPRGFNPQREAEYEERHQRPTHTRYDSRYGGLRGWEPSTSPPPLQFPTRRTVWPSGPVKAEPESPTVPPMCLPVALQANTATDMMAAAPDCSATRATTPVAVAPYRHLSSGLPCLSLPAVRSRS